MELNIAREIINNPAKYGREIGFTRLSDEIHGEWIKNLLQKSKDVTLQAHRGSYKTTCVSIAMSLVIVLFPSDKTLFLRKTDSDTKEVITQVKQILESSFTRLLIQRLYGFPLMLTRATSSEISTNLNRSIKGAPQLIGKGIGGSLTGKHFDRIYTDDIINISDRLSRAERDHTRLIYQELQNIRNRGGRIYNTGTPWHKDDAFSIMPTPVKYDCYSTGLISEPELQEIRDSMLPSLFAANYELRHIAAEDIIFDNPQTGGDPAKVMQANHCHIDAAYGGEDYTAFTICRKSEGKYYVFGKLWHKHVDAVEDEIIKLRKEFNAGKIYCEENADKGYLAKELRRRGERVATYWEDTNKFIKITSYLKGEWRNVVFVEGTDDEYIRQVCDYNEDAEHDDAPDSLASIIRLLWSKRETDAEYVPLFMR